MSILNSNDRNLVSKLGESNCFGEVIIMGAVTELEGQAEEEQQEVFKMTPFDELATLINSEIEFEGIKPAVEEEKQEKKRKRDKEPKPLSPVDHPDAKVKSKQIDEIFEYFI